MKNTEQQKNESAKEELKKIEKDPDAASENLTIGHDGKPQSFKPGEAKGIANEDSKPREKNSN